MICKIILKMYENQEDLHQAIQELQFDPLARFKFMMGIKSMIDIVSIFLILVLGFWLLGVILHNSTLPVSEQLHYEQLNKVERNDSNPNLTCYNDFDFNLGIRFWNNNTLAENKTETCFEAAWFPVSDIGFQKILMTTTAMITEGVIRIMTLNIHSKLFPLPDKDDSIPNEFLGYLFLLGGSCLLADMMVMNVTREMGHEKGLLFFVNDFVFMYDYYGFRYLCIVSNFFFRIDLYLMQFSSMLMLLAGGQLEA